MYKSIDIYDDKPHEECGVFGIFDRELSAAAETYYGIFALQHRGQESAGITVSDGKVMETFRGMGLVTEVFRHLPEKDGHIGIGHVRYSTTGSSIPANVQPLQADSIDGSMALAHNGNLVNTKNLRRRLLLEGSTFQTSMDTEVIIKLLARSRRKTEEEKLICKYVSHIRLNRMELETNVEESRKQLLISDCNIITRKLEELLDKIGWEK